MRPSHAIALGLVAAAALAACSKKEDAPVPAPSVAETPAPVTEAAPVTHPANSHAFTIGQLQAFALRDGGMEVPNDNKVLGVGRTPEEVAAVLAANGQPTDKLTLSIQPLLVKTADKVLLFDTGASSNFGPGSGLLPKSLAEAGIDPATVTDVFISHLHGDHIGGVVTTDGALSFPNATVHISKAEWKFLQEVPMETAKAMGLGNRDAIVAAIKPKVAAFEASAEIVPGVVKAVDIKGHTPGHSGYKISSGAESILYIGDTAHNYIISVQKPDWTIAFDSDAPTAQKSRAALIAESAASGQRIFAVHFPFPGIGKFEKKDDHYVWVAE